MASQLGTAVTPYGHEGLQSLISNEQAQRMMGQQMMAQQQQAALSQQALEQDQAAMAQRQMQFEQGMAQDMAMAQMQFQNASELARQQFQNSSELARQQNEFRSAQDNAMMAWQERQTQAMNKFQLQMELLDAQKEQAISTGMFEAANKIGEQRIALQREHAKRAQAVSFSEKLIGQTKDQANRLLNGYESQLSRTINTVQREQEMGNRFAAQLVEGLNKRARDKDRTTFDSFKGQQEGFWDYFNPLSPSFTGETFDVALGRSRGLRFLNLEPTRGGRWSGMSPTQTTDFSAVAGEVDPATMTSALRQDIVDSTMDAMRSMNIKDFNEGAVRELVGYALDGNKDAVNRVAQAANIPVSTIRVLFDKASRSYDLGGDAWKELVALEEQAIGAAAGQKSLRTSALAKEREAFLAVNKMLRNASMTVPGIDLTDLTAGLEVVKRMKEAGQILPGFESLAASQGLGSEASEYIRLMQSLPGAESELAKSSVELGNLAEEQAARRELDPLLLMSSRSSAMAPYIKNIEGLIGEMGP